MARTAIETGNTDTRGESLRPTRCWGSRIVGALLCIAVSVIHIVDQGGILAIREPEYVGQGYRLLEIAGVLGALLLLAGRGLSASILAAGVAAGPLIGFVLSRSVGLPDYTDDIGNWTEPIAVAAFSVEVALLVLSLIMIAKVRKSATN